MSAIVSKLGRFEDRKTMKAKRDAHWYHRIFAVGALAISVNFLVAVSSWAESRNELPVNQPATAADQEEETLQAEARVNALFLGSTDTTLEGQRCLPARRIRGVNVLDNRTLVFDMGRNQNYLVRLKQECFGLRRNTPISYEVHGSQFCKHDGFRALETWSINQFVPGPRCSIPAFIPITDAERELVRARVKSDRDAKIAARKAEKAARRAERRAGKAASQLDQLSGASSDGESA